MAAINIADHCGKPGGITPPDSLSFEDLVLRVAFATEQKELKHLSPPFKE
jgi:hypothetical protein